jgi:protein phosphatase
MVDDEGIAQILTQETPLEQKVAQLIDAANANGGRDNISVLLAQANEGSRKKGLISRLLGK